MVIKAKVDLTAVDRGFDALTAAARDLSPAFKALKKPARADQRQHAKERSGPDGAWAPKAKSTLAREALDRKRAGKRRGVRKLLGRLPAALAVTSDRNRVVVRSRARGKLSGTQQEGGAAGRGARIPARVFLWVSDALRQVAAVIFERHILGRW